VWGWGTSLGAGHMDPAAAAEAAELIAPRIAVPIHWGTYYPQGVRRGRAVALGEAPRRFADAVARTAPGVRVCLLAPGESVDVSDSMVEGIPHPRSG